MKAEDWKFTAEGGKHALFSYCSQAANNGSCNDPCSMWDGQLLRVSKDDLIQSETASCCTEPDTTAEASSSSSKNDKLAEAPLVYIEQFVAPSLHHYLDVPQTIQLEWDFVRKLREQILAEGSIPQGRFQECYLKQDCQLVVCGKKRPPHARGYLLPDHRTKLLATPIRPVGIRHISSQFNVIAVEIKPKAGYLAFSPLIDPKRRAKYQHSRFVLLQRLFSQGLITKGWATRAAATTTETTFRPSSYDPIDLFSQNQSHNGIRARALSKLMECPQNNFRLWLGEELVLGVMRKNKSLGVDWDRIAEILGIEKDSEKWLVEILCVILDQESFLSDLLRLQKLDILDADGAVLVYQKLVNACGGSHEEAEKLLDTFPVEQLESEEKPCLPSPHQLLDASPFRTPDDCMHVQAFCDITERLSRLLPTFTSLVSHQNYINSAYTSAVHCIESMSVKECRYMLQNWLFSLAMCDVSFFISFYVDDVTPIGGNKDRTSSTTVSRQQGEDQPGVAIVPLANSKCGHTIVVRYEIKVVDCDKKPSKKLRSRCATEKQFENMDKY